MKKIILSAVSSVSLLSFNYSSAWFIDFSSINRTLSWIFSPVLDFFQQVRDYISTFFAFLWDLIEWLYFWFNTIVSHLWESFSDIVSNWLFSSNSWTISYLAAYLGITWNSLFMAIFFCAIVYVLYKFILRLIPIFK